MADRGTYRAVKVVLLDGPDFQELPERARYLFLVLKLSFGPAGIEVHYPEALAFELAAKTGMPNEAVKESLDLLEGAGWIQRERNVLWIVGQLEHDPHMSATNERHRKAIQSHIGGLPRLAIVGRYIERYSDFMEGAPDSLSDSLPHSPEIAPRSREEGVGNRDEGRTTTVDESTEADASDISSLDVTDDDQWATLRGHLFAPLREHIWGGSKPPSNVPKNGRPWREDRELSYIRDWIRGKLLRPDEAEEFLETAPKAMQWRRPASLSWIGADEHIPRIREIVGEIRKDQMARLGEVEGVAHGR